MQALYSALGVRVRADFPLTLQPIDETAGAQLQHELHVELQHTHERSPGGEQTHRVTLARQTLEHPSIEVHTDGDEWSILCEQGERYARYASVGDGRIHVRYTGVISPEDLAAPLEGPALGMALRLEGHLLLHASSVRCGALGVAFGGISGEGKSTLAALLLQRDAEFWGDDILRVIPESATAFPDGRAARLHEASATIAEIPTDQAPAAHLASDKKKLHLANDRFLARAHTLDAFFALDRRHRGDTPLITPVYGADALVALMRSRYPTWMQSPLLDARDFDALATLLSRLRVFRLALPDGLEKMPRAADELLRQIQALTPA